jgi:hypothetical protein
MFISTVNRNALIIFPKKPLIDWINYIFPDKPFSNIDPLQHDGGNIYLLPEKERVDQSMNYLKRNFRNIFENELWDWCTDDTQWPKNITWKLFTEWFHFSIQSVVLDISKEPLEKDECL